MSAQNPFSVPPRVFTKLLSNTAAFKLDPELAAGIKAMSIQWISGTVTLRGNAGTIDVVNATDSTSIVTLTDSAITLSESLPIITLVGSGNDALKCTIDSSAGSAVLILYV